MTTLAFFCTIIDSSDMMEKSYEKLYWHPLQLPQGGNAGHEFIRRLIANGAVIVNSSNKVTEITGAPGSRSPYIGIIISSKTRMRDIGYELINNYDMEPFTGVYTPITIMAAGGAKNNPQKYFSAFSRGKPRGIKPYRLRLINSGIILGVKRVVP